MREFFPDRVCHAGHEWASALRRASAKPDIYVALIFEPNHTDVTVWTDVANL